MKRLIILKNGEKLFREGVRVVGETVEEVSVWGRHITEANRDAPRFCLTVKNRNSTFTVCDLHF